MEDKLTKAEIFKMIENQQISPEEAFQIIKRINQGEKVKNIEKTESQNYCGNEGSLLQEIQNDLIAIIVEILKFDANKISIDDDFREFGFNSFSMGSFKAKINERLGIEIEPYIFFENPTIDLLAQYFKENFKDHLLSHNKVALKQNKNVYKEQSSTVSGENKTESLSSTEKGAEVKQTHQSKFLDESIWILNMAKKLPGNEFWDFWQNLKSKKLPPISTSKVSREILRTIMKSGYKYLHLMVQIPSGKKMELYVAGTGKPILIVTGIGATATLSYYQIMELSSKYQVIVFHLPGCGLSEGLSDLSLSGIGKAVIEVFTELGIQWPIHAIGGSWGGMLVQNLAKEYPEKISSLALVSSVCNVFEEYSGSSDTYLISFNEKMKMDFENVVDGDKYYETYRKSECSDTFILSNYLKYVGKNSPAPHSTLDILTEITTPTLVITGTQDMIVDRKKHSDIIHSKINGSKYVEISGAGHFPNLTHYTELNRIVLEFLENQDKIEK